MDFNVSGKKVLIIVPHQDDEVIGMGGHVAWACRSASEVQIVLMTDGAATGSVRAICGLSPCLRLAEFLECDSQELLRHDASLVTGRSGNLYHTSSLQNCFIIEKDLDRSAQISSAAWGKQRDYEFIQVCETLGIQRKNIVLAYWDPDCPHHIKDGQTSLQGKTLSPNRRIDRFAKAARHYIKSFHPDVIFTMASYEFTEAPNDHWAVAHGVKEEATAFGVDDVFYFHSGRHYRHVQDGGEHLSDRIPLPPEIWEIKLKALHEYLRWNPANGWFGTAIHSVAGTFQALLSGAGQYEYRRATPEP